ncbi:hypothetical protein F443_13164, partial [Phytophthora nicotianae P1569]
LLKSLQFFFIVLNVQDDEEHKLPLLRNHKSCGRQLHPESLYATTESSQSKRLLHTPRRQCSAAYWVDGQGVRGSPLNCAEKFDEGESAVCIGAVTAWWVSICNWTRYFFTEARVTASLLRISLLCAFRALGSSV